LLALLRLGCCVLFVSALRFGVVLRFTASIAHLFSGGLVCVAGMVLCALAGRFLRRRIANNNPTKSHFYGVLVLTR